MPAISPDAETLLLYADVVLAAHAALALFLTVGLAAVVIGGALGWRWVRGRGFRLAQLVGMGVVAAEALLGIACPLTELESALRAAAQAPAYGQSFVAHWLGRLLFYDFHEGVFAGVYVAALVLTLWAWRKWPPLAAKAGRNMGARLLRAGLLWLMLCGAGLSGIGLGAAVGATLETEHLRVEDATGALDQEKLAGFGALVESRLAAVAEFWGVDPRTHSLGKIRVLYDAPLRGQCTATFFQSGLRASGQSQGGQMRTLRVFGCVEAPLMLSHKLTSALMPQPDKLLRNMWGALSEEHVGVARSFPACGQDVDDWVRAAARGGGLIPLSQLGPEHESWGMRDEGGGRLAPFDRQRQQRAYAEAASFARYLAGAYGLDALKRLQRLSHTSGARPWREALGADLDELEAGWLRSLRAGSAGREERVGRLVRILTSGPGDPCERARRMAGADI